MLSMTNKSVYNVDLLIGMLHNHCVSGVVGKLEPGFDLYKKQFLIGRSFAVLPKCTRKNMKNILCSFVGLYSRHHQTARLFPRAMD